MGDASGDRQTFIVPAIKSFDHYDFTRAKISCSLTWLVAKAFGSDEVPEELVDPFYRDQYNQEHLKPPVACLLQSAELYCRAGSLILRSDAVKPLLGHNAVIQALAQKGLYVTDQDRLVTERDLTSTPIHMSSHLALIDTLMMAYTVEMVSVERVMSCINRYSSADPSNSDRHIQQLPYDTEDAITTWVNKVNEHLRDILVEEQKLREASLQESNTTAPKARYRREHAQQRSAPSLPLVENLLKDNTDGCALAALLHFYCPRAVRLEDICLKETMSLADSLYNLQLVQDFCRNNLNHCCHFSLEDMLYAHASIKEWRRSEKEEQLKALAHGLFTAGLLPIVCSNLLVFMAELFWWFEVVKPSFVQPRVFDPEACEPVLSCRNMAPVSSPVKQSNADRPDSPESVPAEGLMKRSTSMSFVDGCVGTWPKEKRSSSRGISFEIPLNGDPTLPPCDAPSLRGMTRSISTDGLGFKVHYASRGGMKRHFSLMPVNVNGQSGSRHIVEEDEDFTVHKPVARNNTFSIKNQSRYSNGVLPESNHNPNTHHGNHSPSTPPSIEEALKIIHNTERPHASLGVGDRDNGFFLHGAESLDPPGGQGQRDDPSSAKAQLNDNDPNSVSTDEVDTGIHVRTEDIQSVDEDSSSLRDYSDIDPDCEGMTRSCPLPDRVEGERSRERGSKRVDDTKPEGTRGEGGDRSSPCPSSVPTLPRSCTVSPTSSSGGSGGALVRMTSFAEQKFRKLEGRSSGGTTPDSSDINVPYTHPTKFSSEISAPPLPIISPTPTTPSPRDPSHLIASEMIQLKMKLEEKRRAIEAQKKKVEAAFTRHRQKMGRTAFLNVVRRKGVTSPVSPRAGGAETPSPEPLTSSKETAEGSMERVERCKPDGAAPKFACEDGGGVTPGEVDLTEYTRSIERLNTSLGFLQTEMQRLAQQQEKIMAMREQQPQQQAWVIPPPAPSPHRQLRELRSSSVSGRGSGRGSVGSLSPILSSSGSPHAANRSPAGIKRRPASFHARTPRTPRPNDLKVTPFSRMLNTPTSVDSLPRLRRFAPSQTQISSFAYLGHDDGHEAGNNLETKDNSGKAKEKGDATAKKSAGTLQTDAKESSKEKKCESQEERTDAEQAKLKGEVKERMNSEVLVQPVSEIQGTGGSRHKGEPQDKRDLVEVPLSGLKAPEGQGQEMAGEEASVDPYGDDQKVCCGFFFKDDVKGEEDMAAKKAALLEKRLRREKEAQERKQQQELDQEQKREAARLKAEEEQQKKDDEKARRDYIKNEYLRRKQLKLMEDMDDIIKPRSGSLKKKPRPKSIHRDVVESSTPPVRGVHPRAFSVSSISLASLNLTDNDNNRPDNKKTTRPDSAEGFSSCPSGGSRNGEKDWENDSTTSSTPSNTEYTGPKLYKEPSAKSNKYIIQNALAHCCLAGKVNEGQKNKILDEMEKSEANNFLVLFRDAGCQFRSVYTYYPETEEISKLAGIGPKSITTKMIECLYKYNSDRKQFSRIPAKTMSASVDAITIASHLWQTKKQGTPKKLHQK